MSGRRAKAIRREVIRRLSMGDAKGWHVLFRNTYRKAKRAWRAR
jgi:hypothetical protein